MSDLARLFFGAQVEAPWPGDYPSGRRIKEEMRHITLAFLGEHSISKVKQHLATVPKPPFSIGPQGIGHALLFLPEEESRVVALKVQWLFQGLLDAYQMQLTAWLSSHGYDVDKRPFLPHVTIARAPFEKRQWEQCFSPLPLFVKAIHLYQSVGDLNYESLWQILLTAPFEEFEHTADIAFHIRGVTLDELYSSAQLALAFKCPLFLEFYSKEKQQSLEEIILSLNAILSQVDERYGSPFKAVSFHGKIEKDAQNLLHWDMIVDV